MLVLLTINTIHISFLLFCGSKNPLFSILLGGESLNCTWKVSVYTWQLKKKKSFKCVLHQVSLLTKHLAESDIFNNKCSFQICVIYTLGGSDLLCSNSYVEWRALLSSVTLFVSHKCCKLNTLFLNYILKICKWNRSPLDPEARFPRRYTKWNSDYWNVCQLHCNNYSQK